MSGDPPDVRALLRRLANLPEQELRALLRLVEQEAPPDSGESLLTGTIAVDIEVSGVLNTPPVVEESAASLWETIRPRTPDQGIAWVVELRKVLQAIILLLATVAASAGAQGDPAIGPAPAESGQSFLDHPRENPSR